MNSMYYHRVIGFLINVQVQGQHPHPLPRSWQLREWQISYQLSRYAYHESFHSLQSLSVSCFQVILGLPGLRFPSTCMSKAVLIAPLERFTCPYQWSPFSFRMRSRSSMPSRASSSLDLVVTMSCGLTLIDLSHHWRSGFVNGRVSLALSITFSTQELYTQPHVLRDRWREERTGSSFLNFFQVVFTCYG